MKTNLRKMLQLLVLLILCLVFSATACAEEGAAQQAGASMIAGFEPLGDTGEVTVQYKLAIATLQKRFPEQLSGSRSGLVIFGRSGSTAEAFARDHDCFFIQME